MKCFIYNIIKLKKRNSEIFIIRNDSESNCCINGDFDLSSMYISESPCPEEAKFGTKIMLFVISFYDKIITDRLHVAIAAALLDKEVYIVDNSYGKLSAVYSRTLKYFNNVKIY